MASTITGLETALGLTGTVCFALMLAPQAWYNYRRQSTDGLSASLILVWHLASILYAAYEVSSEESLAAVVWPLASMAGFMLFSCLIEAQFGAYGPRAVPLVAGFLGVCLLTAALTYACSLVLALDPTLREVFGATVPSALLAVGFLPQLYEFLRSWSAEGYAFGVTAFDLVGSAANTGVVFLHTELQLKQRVTAAMPFLVIFFMQVVLLLIVALVIALPRHQLPAEALLPKACSPAEQAPMNDAHPREHGSVSRGTV